MVISVSHDSTICGRASNLDILLACHALLINVRGVCDELKGSSTRLPGEDAMDQSCVSTSAGKHANSII